MVDGSIPLKSLEAFFAPRTIRSTRFMGRFSNEVWRIDLNDGGRYVAKVPFASPRPGEMPGGERTFYSRLARHADLPTLRCLNAEDRDAAFLVFDYHEFAPFNFFDGVGRAHASAAVDALATWHAHFWETTLEGFEDYGEREVRQAIQARYDESWRAERCRLVGFCPEFAMLGDALVGRLAATLEPMAEPRTLIHSDPHAENVPLTRRGALLLDWEEPAFANPGLDLAVFTTMSFREVDRPWRELEVVERHATAIRDRGLAWPDPWRDYRLGLLRRAVRIVEIASVGFSSLPWVFRRSAIAAVQHRCAELIR